MASSFDDVIFLLSTECFACELLAECSKEELATIKKLARSMIPEIIRGGDNYYMCADFSRARKEATKKKFMDAARRENISPRVINEINLSYTILQGITGELSTASHVIDTIAIKLYWHDVDDFILSLPKDLEASISSVVLPGFDRSRHGFEWEDIWLASESKWDKYIMSLMDGIDEVPYLTFTAIKYFSTRFDYMYDWKVVLGKQTFAALLEFMAQEAHANLDTLNPAAAAEIDGIISAL